MNTQGMKAEGLAGARVSHCFGWLSQVAEVAQQHDTSMSTAIGLDQIGDVIRLESIKEDLTTAINEATILLVDLKARAEVLSQMAKDLM